MAPNAANKIPAPFLLTTGSTTIDEIIVHLRSRFQGGQPCTRIGAATLLCINPYDDTADKPGSQKPVQRLPSLKDLTDPNWDKSEPCVEEIAAAVYLKVLFGGEEQVVVAR